MPDSNETRASLHLHELVHDNSDWLWEVDAQGCYTFCSSGCERMLGYPPEQLLGRSRFALMAPAEAKRVQAEFAAIVSRQQPFHGLLNRNLHADGHVVVLEASGVPLFDEHDRLRGYRGIDRDVTPDIRGTGGTTVDQRLFQLETLYAAAPVALCLIDRNHRYVAVNEAHARIVGIEVEQMVGMRVADLLPQAGANETRDFALLDAGLEVPDHMLEWNGGTYHVRVRGVRNVDGRVIGLTVALTDISEHLRVQQRLALATEALAESNRQLEQANQQLRRFATLDHLTGLVNRRGFDRAFAEGWRGMRERGDALSVLMLDVDYFKQYNDRYGHLQGDECLRLIAAALLRSVRRENDVVARYGGEEFALLLPGTTAAGAAEVVERVREELRIASIPHHGSPWQTITASIGVATVAPADLLARDSNAVCERVMMRADRALYQAKQQGRNRAVVSVESVAPPAPRRQGP